jgi:chromosomal replication initiator protein
VTQQEVQQVWDKTLDLVRAELNVPTFKTWFEHTKPLGLIDDTLIISVHNDFARDWLESRYAGLLRSMLTQVAGSSLDISFTVAGDAPAQQATEGQHPPEVPVDLDEVEQQRVKEASEGEFDPKYTFDSFVLGGTNRFAYNAALAVAESPGKAYNPLYIYGGVGLGKTHLLQAIGHYAKRHFPRMTVKYVSTEQLVNDFINSVTSKDTKRIEGFRRQYRTNDLLLIDDIQFLSTKERTQEEFFHMFNTLQQAGKQIVLSSDRPPREIATLEERLRSRFDGGLITDIQPPDLETRIAILMRKCEAQNLQVPEDVITFVADRISSNIRELEGALIRIVAYSSLARHTIDLDLATSVLKDIFPERAMKPISVATIQQEVCKFYGVGRTELVGSKRDQNIVYPRQIAMYLVRELTDLSLPNIGKEFGGRDHTTVMYANKKIQRLMNQQRSVFGEIQTLTNLVKQKN